MPKEFVHLHVHSHYSLLEGLPKIPQLLKKAASLGMKAIALTDRGVLYGAIEFYQEAKKAGIKPILGMETAVRHAQKDSTPAAQNTASVSFLVLLAKNHAGYKNLLKISSHLQLQQTFDEPAIDAAILSQYTSGLIALSGAADGVAARAFSAHGESYTLGELEYWKNFFGKDNFFLELHDRPTNGEQQKLNTFLIRAAQQLTIPLVATNDVHYLEPDDADAQDILACIKAKKLIQDEDRHTLSGEDYSLQSPESMMQIWKNHPEVLENTLRIASRCDLDIELGVIQLPHYELPSGLTADQRLNQICESGLQKKYPIHFHDDARARLKYELEIIHKTGYASYFLIVQDFINWAKENNIVVGPGRGSAAGSIVAFLSNITDIDPILYELSFERFLNPDRVSMPDIDTDFDDERRDDVIRYVEKKYGKDHVAQIITFGTMAARASIRDVGRVLGFSYSYCDRIAKLVPMFCNLSDALTEVPELKDLYANDPDCTRLLDTAKKLEGVARHASVHACGIVITKNTLTEYTPIQYASQEEDVIITQYSLHPIEDLGILKMDFLGLKNLTIIRNTLDIIRKTTHTDIDIHTIPLDDPKAFRLLQEGKTTGVFQLESSGMKRYLKELKPTELEDIIAMVALYRPGPMEFIPQYINGKRGKRSVEYLHPALESILQKTYGIAVYQEQIMEIARKLGGFTFGEADVLRKAVGKKIKALLVEQEEKMTKGMIHNGIQASIAKKIWEFILPFARYGFNRSHAACYAMIAYQTAYLKANFPAQFMAALMTSDHDNSERIAIEVSECREMNISVLPPDINESFSTFTVVRDSLQSDDHKPRIRFGLTAIKNVGDTIIRRIIDERKTSQGTYKDLKNFLSRVKHKDLNKKSLESLIKCGAMDCFEDRNTLLYNLEILLQYAKKQQIDAETGQGNLFQAHSSSYITPLTLLPAVNSDTQEKLLWEKQLLGLYISEHPLTQYKDILSERSMPILEVKNLSNNTPVRIIGMVMKMKRFITKNNEQMLFATLEDPSADCEILIFPKTFKETSFLWQEDAFLRIDGKVTTKDKAVKVIADTVAEIDMNHIDRLPLWKPAARNRTKAPQRKKELWIRIILPHTVKKHIFSQLKDIFTKNSGSHIVILETTSSDNLKNKEIKTHMQIAPTQEVIAQIETLIGEGHVIFSEQKI